MRRLLLLLLVLLLAGCSSPAYQWEGRERPRLDQQPSQDNPPPDVGPRILPPLVGGSVIRIPTGGKAGSSAETVASGAPVFSRGRIALTFDAGWEFEHTQDLLSVLRENNVRATFFLRGKWAQDHPQLVLAIALDGHAIQNHSFTHPHMPGLTLAKQRQEIEQTTAIIERLTAQRPWLFRPPYGESDARLSTLLAEMGYPYSVLWSIDTLDWMGTDADLIYQRVERGLKDGCIILMHVGGAQTVVALPRIIQLINQRGYTPVFVDELFPPVWIDGALWYRVQPADTWEEVATRYQISIDDLLAANR